MRQRNVEILVLTWLAVGPALATGATESVHTEISSEACAALPESEGGGLRCPGTAGYELLVRDEDGRATLSVVSPDGTAHDLRFSEVVTRSVSKLGPQAEWKLKTGEAGALIVRLDAHDDPDDAEKVTSYLVAVKIDPKEVCAGYRFAPGPFQEQLAQEFADDAANLRCLAPLPDPAEVARRIAWLRENSVPITTLSPHADPADLRPLMDAIGTARVVQLGEANHGDGATMEAKVRLIHFLHQEMGFDVLAWEAGFFDCREMDAGLRGSEPVADVASRCLYRTWWQAAEIESFLEEVRASWQTPRPLRIVGFDSRVSTEAGRNEGFPRFIFDFFDRVDPTLISEKERADLTAMSAGLVPQDYFENPGPRPYNRELPRRLIATLDEGGDKLQRLNSPAEIAWTRQALVSLMNMDRALEGGQARGAGPDGFSRDRAMAENLLWWLRGPLAGEKVIVWAHNFHVQEGLMGDPVPSMPFAGPAGHHLHEALGEAVYTIAFLSHGGATGYPGTPPKNLPEPVAGSMDSMLHATGHAVLFLDLLHRPEDHWLRGSWFAGFNFYNSLIAEWSRQYDGIFYIDVQHPATLISALQAAGDVPP